MREWDEARMDWLRDARCGVRIGQNLMHAATANPVNKRARRAHSSLASKNDCEVKIV